MERKLYLKLIAIPRISILLFFVLVIIAINFYPGTVIEVIQYKSNAYSFSHDFFSGLGVLKTNTDNLNTNIPRVSNFPSYLFFNLALLIVGLSISTFYYSFNLFFVEISDSVKTQKLSSLLKPFGILAGVFFAGVGLVPHDVNFLGHIFFAYGAFTLLLIVSIIQTLTIFYSKYLNNKSAYSYLLFCILLIFYLILIFLGPEIGPGKTFTEKELVIQVVAQKAIVISFILAFLVQTQHLRNFFKN